MNTKDFKAFTLVELIVVITILAILGTIAFISLQGFSSDARDSTRISDTSTMKKSLELYSISEGEYPLPNDNEEVAYDGEILWYQGTFGDSVIEKIYKNLNEAPLDPLLGTEYVYSVSNDLNEYEILTLLESDEYSYNQILIPQANAATENFVSKINGNYNGIFVSTENYVIPTPSLITSEDITGGLTLDETNIKSQVVSGEDNIPSIGEEIESVTGGLTGLELSVYNGKITDNSTDTEKLALMTSLKTAYSGSELSETNIYKNLLETTEDEDLLNFVDSIVLNTTNTTTTTTTIITDATCEAGTIDGYTYESLSHEGTQSVTKTTGDGTETTPYSISSSEVSCNNGEITIETLELYSSCNEILTNNASQLNEDGVYTIDPENNGTGFEVYCDMSSDDGGGWTLAGISTGTTTGTEILTNNVIGNITDINTSTTSKMETGIINTILFGGDRKLKLDDSDNGKWIIEYSEGQSLDFENYSSYNISVTDSSGESSIFYDSHQHFINFSGISTDTFVSDDCPSGCRMTYGTSPSGVVGDTSWAPIIRRTGGSSSDQSKNYKLWVK